MKCFHCGGEMKRGKTTYTVNRKGYHLLIHEVPAWICTQCREVYFEGEEVDSIQEVIKSIDEKIGKLRRERVAVQ